MGAKAQEATDPTNDPKRFDSSAAGVERSRRRVSAHADARVVQARARAELLYRAEGVRFLERALAYLGPDCYRVLTVPDLAAACGVSERTARSWLGRFDRDGVMVWLRRVGRCARSTLCLPAVSRRVSRFVAHVRRRAADVLVFEVKNKN